MWNDNAAYLMIYANGNKKKQNQNKHEMQHAENGGGVTLQLWAVLYILSVTYLALLITRWLDSDSVVTITNCRQHSDWAAQPMAV